MTDKKRSAGRRGPKDIAADPTDIDGLRDLVDACRQMGMGEDDPDGRCLLFICDMEELRIAHAFSDLGERFAPFHAARLCYDGWRLPPPDWALKKLAECAAALASGSARLLPDLAHAKRYRACYERLRAAWRVHRGVAKKGTLRQPESLPEICERWAKELSHFRPDLFSKTPPVDTVRGWRAKWLPAVFERIAATASKDDRYARKAANTLRIEAPFK